jgi:hypothetical protein
MKDFVLTPQTATTLVGELLRGVEEEISVRDESGDVIARIVPAESGDSVTLSDDELAIIRRRLSDRAGSVTTAELNSYLQSLDSGQRP